MAEAIQYAARLADTIGARPAGTEEEQQASFFIEEVLSEEAQLPTEIEEFNCNLGYRMPRAVCCITSALLAILSFFLPLLVLPAFLVSVITGFLFITDMLGVSPFKRSGRNGISQNVLAKYVPPADAGTRGRKRKVIVVAHYDTGKVRRDAQGGLLGALPLIYWCELIGMALIPIALLVRFMLGAPEYPLPLAILLVFGIVCALVAVLGFLLHQTAQYNRGANVNGAGVAVMLECAKRVREVPEDFLGDILLHSEEELRDQGLIPEGATFSGGVAAEGAEGGSAGAAEDADAARAQAAQAAAAIPVAAAAAAVAAGAAADAEAAVVAGVADEAVQAAAAAAGVAGDAAGAALDGATVAFDARAAYSAAVSQGLAEPEPDDDPNVPDWYKKAMKKANHHPEDAAAGAVQRSKFADALDNAQAVSAGAIEEEEPVQSEAERRLAQLRASIMGEPGAPGVATAQAEEQAHQHTGGVGGYLSSKLEYSNYEAASASLDALAEQEAEEAARASVQLPVSDEEAEAAAEEAAAAAAAAADKTISFIPVEVDVQAIKADDEQAKAAAAGVAEGAKAASRSASVSAPIHERKRRTIDLPSLTGSLDGVNARLQDAPLSDEAASSEDAIRARRKARQDSLAAASTGTFAGVDAAGVDEADEWDEASDDSAVTFAGAFVSSSATTTFQPLTDEFVEGVDEEDLYIEDADDSDYEHEFTAAGAPVGPGYVEMPKSRASRLFDKLRGKKNKHGGHESSMRDAYGLDAGWDARSAGAARGGWESFREEDDAYEEEWNGGAFSKVREGRNAREEREAGEGREGRTRRGSREAREGREGRGADVESFDRRSQSPFDSVPLKVLSAEERELIQHFNSGAISCEVWFLAVGAELANNAGVKSFIEMHSDDLRGAMVISLDGLGAGNLTLIEEEGIFTPKKPPTRLKRYVAKAASALGMKIGKGTMRWRNSGAYCFAKHGVQAVHIVGMLDGKPAYAAQANDVMTQLSEEKLEDNTAFVMELLRQI